MNWLLLPKATKCGRFLSPLAINRFEGEPSIVTNIYNVNPPFPPNEDPKAYYDVYNRKYTFVQLRNLNCIIILNDLKRHTGTYPSATEGRRSSRSHRGIDYRGCCCNSTRCLVQMPERRRD